MIDRLNELLRYRDLIRQLVIRDLKVRYKNSVFGFLWTLLNPLFMMVVFTIVFTIMLPQSAIAKFPIFVLCGLLPWNFFSASVMTSTSSIVGNGHLIRKVYFPREALPLSTVLSNLINFLLALLVLFFAMLLLRVPFTPWALLLPLIVAVQFFFTLGWAFFLSAATVFYRDVPMIMDVLMLAWFFLTPIFYPMSVLPQSQTLLGITLNIQRLAYILNPMASLVASYRVVLYHGASPAWDFLLRTILTTLAFPVLGYLFFARYSWTFAEEV